MDDELFGIMEKKKKRVTQTSYALREGGLSKVRGYQPRRAQEEEIGRGDILDKRVQGQRRTTCGL